MAERAGLAPDQWTFCWQSAGHEPGEWMKPDFTDLLPRLRDAGHTAVLVAPIQFLADHLEILYDVDIGARDSPTAVTIRRCCPRPRRACSRTGRGRPCCGRSTWTTRASSSQPYGFDAYGCFDDSPTWNGWDA